MPDISNRISLYVVQPGHRQYWWFFRYSNSYYDQSLSYAYWNSLGATATPLDFSELYIGLQQGLVDAQENPLDIFLSSKFYEQQDYVINTKHNVFVATLLMNQDTWDSLPSDLQEILNECFVEIGQYGTQLAKRQRSQPSGCPKILA